MSRWQVPESSPPFSHWNKSSSLAWKYSCGRLAVSNYWQPGMSFTSLFQAESFQKCRCPNLIAWKLVWVDENLEWSFFRRLKHRSLRVSDFELKHHCTESSPLPFSLVVWENGMLVKKIVSKCTPDYGLILENINHSYKPPKKPNMIQNEQNT